MFIERGNIAEEDAFIEEDRRKLCVQKKILFEF
jgi:hypothetical protein